MREPRRWGFSVSRSGYFQVSVITVQVIRARREERVLTEAFGAEYEAYRNSTWF